MVRVKRRYFVFQFHFDSTAATATIKSSQIYTTLETTIARLYGDVGVARFTRNLSIIYYNSSTHVAIVRCLRDDKHLLQTATTFVSKLCNDPVDCSIQTLHVGGSIRQCKRYLVRYCVEQLLAMKPLSTTQPPTTARVISKKNKMTWEQRSTSIDNEKRVALQRLLTDSRIESNSNLVLKHDDDESGKRK